ncbi:GTP1/OBG sub domain protein [Candidatus Saccharibacteria bacterium RIFCSPHIGHO2_12_FULL_47_17]|nr:MAG: GTP1/OBG sub domain protein [Candidatus Saccharibacteria bacterium RIFCSPHIGHO2_12_FULL_47_17]
MAFVDRVEVTFKAGDGGNGVVSFRHEKFRKLGGPDGGDGGKGGDIILIASNREHTLANFRYKKFIKAASGQNGASRRRHGKNGDDLRLSVPVGTVIVSKSEVLVDLAVDGQQFTVAHGGSGGYGNAHFASSTRQAPRVAEKGDPGETLATTLELKMIADVGIVGLPNAGKSTFLSVVSNARPAIAAYPFTTLTPNLGVVDIDGKISLLFADIPGLIEGASQGKGLGDEFLRHIERTVLLIHLIDAYSEDITSAYKVIIQELHDYKIDLSKRPQIVALTKTEGMPKHNLEAKIKAFKKVAPKGTTVLAISSHSSLGIKELLRLTQTRLDKIKKQSRKKSKPAELPIIGLRESDEGWQVKKLPGGYLVTGKKIERFAKRTYFGDYHGEQRFRDIMYKMGIMAELERQGIDLGQTIQIGSPAIVNLEY